jgi:FkbM family methyltransferase
MFTDAKDSGMLLNRLIRPFGYELRRKARSRDFWTNIDLPRTGTLIDIGVGYGTHNLYEKLPDAFLLLVDPLPECEEAAARALAARKGKFVQSAVGAAEAEVEMNVESDIGKSSLLDRAPLTQTGNVAARRKVSVRPLDAIVAEAHAPAPYGVKIDTEGYEMEALKGATDTLAKALFVICECSVKRRFEGSYRFEDLIAFMSDKGFSVDTLSSGPLNPQGISTYADILFLKQNG